MNARLVADGSQRSRDWKLWNSEAVSRALVAACGERPGTLCGCNDGGSRFGALMIVEQNGSERLAHGPFEIEASMHRSTWWWTRSAAVVDKPRYVSSQGPLSA